MSHINAVRNNTEKLLYWEAVIAEWKQSGKSQTQYCKEKELNISTFGYWQQKSLKQKNLLIPVKISEARLAEPIIIRIETKMGLRISVPSTAKAADLESIFKLLGVVE